MNTCIATLTSLSLCIKAQRILSKEAIFCKVVSVDPRLTRRGCAYGIEFSRTELQRVNQILKSHGIRYGQIL